MAVWSTMGVGLIALMARHRQDRPRAADRAAAAAASLHMIPTEHVTAGSPAPPQAVART